MSSGFLKRLLLALLGILLVAIAAFAIMVFLAGGDADIIANDSISRVCVAEIVVWIALRICEQLLSILAKLILKRKKRY